MPLKVLVIDPNLERGGAIEQALAQDDLTVEVTPTLEQGLGALLKGGYSMMMLSADFGAPPLTAWWNQAEAVARGITTVLLGSGDAGGVPVSMVMPDPVDPIFLADQVRMQLGTRKKPAAPSPPAQEAQAGASETPAPPSDPLAALQGGTLASAPLVSPAQPEAAAPELDQDTGFLEPTSLESATPPAPEFPAQAAPEPEPAASMPETPAPQPNVEMDMAGITEERIQELVTELARKTVEKVVWDTVPQLVNQLIQEKQAEQDRIFAQIVERVVWETVPPMAESIVKQEVRRLSEGP